jgi:hypothetical protein
MPREKSSFFQFCPSDFLSNGNQAGMTLAEAGPISGYSATAGRTSGSPTTRCARHAWPAPAQP